MRLRSLSPLWRLIALNVAVFLSLRLTGIAAMIGGWDIDPVVDALALPPDVTGLLQRPWTIVTYMFTQYGTLHLLFNMTALYWFGRLFTLRNSGRRLVTLYLLCGAGGGAAYMAWAALSGSVSATPLVGASAAVMGILVATAITMPAFEVQLLPMTRRVRLLWVALGAIALFALGLAGDNAATHVAHLGGMAAGAVSAVCLRYRLTFRLPSFKMPRRPKSRPEQSPKADIDTILFKVKQSGYTSLTPGERAALFDVSRRR